MPRAKAGSRQRRTARASSFGWGCGQRERFACCCPSSVASCTNRRSAISPRSSRPWKAPAHEPLGAVRERFEGKEVSMPTIKEAAAEFLANKRVAVTANADEVEGDRCYHDLRSIPGGVEAVVIGTRPETAEETMRECAELWIKHVSMHRRPGARQRLEGGGRVRPRRGHRGDRLGLPLHVRPHRRSRAQGDALRAHAEGQRPEERVSQGRRAGPLESPRRRDREAIVNAKGRRGLAAQ